MSIHMSCPLNLYIDIVDISLSLQEMRDNKLHFSFLVSRNHFLSWSVLGIVASFQRSRKHSEGILQFIQMSQLVQQTNFSNKSSRKIIRTIQDLHTYAFKNPCFWMSWKQSSTNAILQLVWQQKEPDGHPGVRESAVVTDTMEDMRAGLWWRNAGPVSEKVEKLPWDSEGAEVEATVLQAWSLELSQCPLGLLEMHTLRPHPRRTEWTWLRAGPAIPVSASCPDDYHDVQVRGSARIEAKEGSTSCTHFQFLPKIWWWFLRDQRTAYFLEQKKTSLKS